MKAGSYTALDSRERAEGEAKGKDFLAQGAETIAPPDRFKIVLIGGWGVGKTSIMLRFVRGEFDNRQPSTLQASFLDKKITVDGKVLGAIARHVAPLLPRSLRAADRAASLPLP